MSARTRARATQLAQKTMGKFLGAAEEIFGFDRLPPDDRNTLITMFLYPSARRLFGDSWEDQAKRMVAQFRPTHDLWAGDPAFVELLERLRKGNPAFSAWWDAHDIRSSGSGQKLLHHSKKGLLRFDYATFQSNDGPPLILIGLACVFALIPVAPLLAKNCRPPVPP